MRYFLIDSPSQIGQVIQLTADESHHVCRVLRLKENDIIGLLDGLGGKYKAQIKSVFKKNVSVYIQDKKVTKKPSSTFSIALCLIKDQGLQIAVQKSAELGARHVYLLHSQYSLQFQEQRLLNKLDKLQTIARESLKQCQSPFLTTVSFEGSIDSFFKRKVSSERKYLLVHPDQLFLSSFKQSQESFSEALFFVGPEGGWSDEELSLARDENCQELCLSPYILRAETAVVCAGSYFNYQFYQNYQSGS